MFNLLDTAYSVHIKWLNMLNMKWLPHWTKYNSMNYLIMNLCFKSVGCDAMLPASQFPTFGGSTASAPSVSSSPRWLLGTKDETIRNVMIYPFNNSVTSHKTWSFSNTTVRTYRLGSFNQLPSTANNLFSANSNSSKFHVWPQCTADI